MQFDDLIIALSNIEPSDLSWDFLKNFKRKFVKENKIAAIPSNIQLLNTYRKLVIEGIVPQSQGIESILKKRPIRSMSGIVSVQVLTKPFWCPGKCIFCPNDFTMPKSYINTEPGAMRALLNNFDPIKQVRNRLLSLRATGHSTDKIEMIVLGGTRDVYPQEYKERFLKSLYDACNAFDVFYKTVKVDSTNPKSSKFVIEDSDITFPKEYQETLKINETGANRIIGLTIETRPEYVTDDNCRFWREFGVTRLEMGVQNMFDDVLDANKRGHSVDQARWAVHKLRQYGFKFSLHMMPGLYMSTYEKDLESFRILYNDPYFKPDEIKFYPTSVIPNTELYDLYQKGEYKPLDTEVIKTLIKETFLEIIPSYTRIKRLIRDIPATEIIAGSNITNLSQLTHDELKKEWKDSPKAEKLYKRIRSNYSKVDTLKDFFEEPRFVHHDKNNNDVETTVIGDMPDFVAWRNFVCIDTRSREIRNRPVEKNNDSELLVIRQFNSSAGKEFFISFEDKFGYLYGFTRLLLPSDPIDYPGLGKTTALIRELHIYGQVATISEKNTLGHKSQHKGLGGRLMEVAENIASHSGYERLSVISGIGVRGYYEKLGYSLEGTYVVKELLSKQ